MIDQVSVFKEPFLFSYEHEQATVVGIDRLLNYQALSAGDSTQQLLAGDEVALESVNEPLNLKSLRPEDSGSYRLKISNTFGESISDPIEITIYDTLGKAVEQPDLLWQYEGEQLWIPQIYETYDGQDAAATLDQSNTYGAVFTSVNGSAFITFWWKKPNELPETTTQFRVNDSEIVLNHPGGGWQQAKVLLTAQSNELKWFTGFFDRLQIEYLDNDPFKLWAFQKFEEGEVLENFESVRDGDRDLDGFSNFLEWILNKSIDFPNGSLDYNIVETDGARYLAVTFSRPANLGSYSLFLEATNDFQTWEKVNAVATETYHPSNDTFTVTFRDSVSFGEGARFIRLTVSEEDG
jgi:hypothetical protein